MHAMRMRPARSTRAFHRERPGAEVNTSCSCHDPTSIGPAYKCHKNYRGGIAKLVVVMVRAALHRRQAFGGIICDNVGNKVQTVRGGPAINTTQTFAQVLVESGHVIKSSIAVQMLLNFLAPRSICTCRHQVPTNILQDSIPKMVMPPT